MSLQTRQFQLTDALIIGYFSVVGYLLAMSKEFAYLDYFNIPSYFANTNILDSVRNMLLIILDLIVTYLLYN